MRVKELLARGLKRAGATALHPIGFTPAHRTSPAALAAFLAGLHPIDAGHQLIRLGRTGDGGYLVPDDLDGITTCLSAGVGNDSSFELDCAERGMQVFLTDGSVASPAAQHSAFHFQQLHLGAATTSTEIALDDWADRSVGDLSGDLLVKIDIEGAEYQVLTATSAALLARTRIVVIEFHELHRLFIDAAFPFLCAAFDRITATHDCVHIHPNNGRGVVTDSGVTLPRVAEFTFLRRDRARSRHPATRFPHPLDSDCTADPTLVLPSSLFSRPA